MRPTLSILVLAAAGGCGRSPTPVAVAHIAPPARPAEARRAAPAESPAPSKPVTHQSLAAVGLDPDALDRTADPCDDFYQFACGGWLQRTEIPADKPATMRSFAIDATGGSAPRNLDYAHAILEDARANPEADPVARQLATFYGSCMDEPAIEKAGLAALAPALAVIERIKDTRSLTAAVAMLQAGGTSALFVLAPTQDPADAHHVIAGIDQGGLGLPGRDYYLGDDEASLAARAAYESYAEAVLSALGHKAAKQEAAEIVGFEQQIARLARDRAASRDPATGLYKLDRAGLARAMPRLDWNAFWPAVGLKGVAEVAVTSPALLAGLDRLLATTRPETWRAYLALALAGQAAQLSTRELEEAEFKLESALSGQPEMPPRWKRCVAQTERALGDLVGQSFVRDRFGDDSRAAAEHQIRALIAAMAAELDALPWLDPATRAEAQAKLAAMTYQIGHPRRWRTYACKLDPRTWTANALALRKAGRAHQLARIGQPVDQDEWRLSAQQVDARYDLLRNALELPAGILQPPFYSPAAALPVNLGGMGVVVGHELTHGFDDQGARHDAAGNLVTWWQPAAEQQFTERARCVADQYSSYDLTAGGKLDGAGTAAEDIADIGGVKLAFAAYRQLRSAAPDTVIAEGFTEDQQFFLGFGQAWCAKLRPEYERLRAAVDVRAPPRWRVDGALSATPEFARTFRCKTGSRMVPARPCVVW